MRKEEYINAEDNIFFKRSVDACNFFGCNYRGFQKGFVKHPIEKDKYLWFPKIGMASNKCWHNMVTDNGKIILERKKERKDGWPNDAFSEDKYAMERVTCTGEMNASGKFIGYRFRGVFTLDKEETKKKGICVYKRVSKKAKGYS